MENTLFLEDCDLLDAINIENTINESNELELLEQVVTEQEMMISLYEHQRFMVEQDTQIFMRLKYEPVNEAESSLFKKIVTVIKEMIKRIKDLIMKFINFITGKRKESSSNTKIEKAINHVEENQETISDIIDDNIDECKKEQDLLNDFIEKTTNIVDSMVKENLQSDVDKIKDKLDSIESKYCYIPIIITESALRKVNPIQKIEGLEDAVEHMKKLLGLAKKVQNLSAQEVYDELDKFDRLHRIDIEYLDDKYNEEWYMRGAEKLIIIEYDNLCTKKEYFEKYYKPVKSFYRNYNSESSKELHRIQQIYNQHIKPIESEISSIVSKYSINENDSNFKIVRNIKRSISHVYGMTMAYIKTQTKIESGYQAYLKNIKTTASLYKQVNSLQHNSAHLKQTIERIGSNNTNNNSNFFSNIDFETFDKMNPGLREDILKILKS